MVIISNGDNDMANASIYIGTPAALQAEIGLLPCYSGKYVVAAFFADGTEATPASGIANKREAQAAADELKAWLESEGEAPQIIWVA